MTEVCGRVQLQLQFNQWLTDRYSELALQFVDRDIEAKKWVRETGEFIPGTGLCVWKRCRLCGQYPRVLEDGRISMTQDEPFCEIATQPALVKIAEFNR